jgi:hypothetical protein
MSKREPSSAKLADSKQSERFIRTARELGCDEDPEAFKRVVRKLAGDRQRLGAERKRMTTSRLRMKKMKSCPVCGQFDCLAGYIDNQVLDGPITWVELEKKAKLEAERLGCKPYDRGRLRAHVRFRAKSGKFTIKIDDTYATMWPV